MQRTLRFQSSSSKEWVFDSQENPIAPGARELTDRIVAELNEHIPHVTDRVQHSFYGWGFSAKFDRALFYHVLNPVDAVYLTVQYKAYWLHWFLLKGPKKRFDDYISLLRDVLGRIPGVTNIESVIRMARDSRQHRKLEREIKS